MKKEQFLEVCRKNLNNPTPEDLKFLETLGGAVEQAFQESAVERNNALKTISDQLGTIDNGESVAGIIRGLAGKIDELEKKATRKLSNEDIFKLRTALESKKDEIKRCISTKGRDGWEMEFKAKRAASAMMTTATLVTGAIPLNTDNVFEDIDVTVIRYPANFIGDAISSSQVARVPSVLKWKEEVTAGDGTPDAVLERGEKPIVDYKFVWKFANRVKYAGRIEMSEEVEIDFEQLTLDVVEMFERDVLRKYNAGMLAAILAWAGGYTTTSLDGTITLPTLMNVVNAGKLLLQTREYTGDTLVLNPSDYATTQNMQNANGDPLFIADNVLFPGLNLFVTNNMTAGTALLFESGIIREQHGSFILRQGQYNEQFIHNERTIIGEIYSIMKLPTESKKGVVKLDIDTVKEALKVPVTPAS